MAQNVLLKLLEPSCGAKIVHRALGGFIFPPHDQRTGLKKGGRDGAEAVSPLRKKKGFWIGNLC